MHTLQISIYVLGLLIGLALVFDFMHGFHDAANFIAIFAVGLGVAATVGKGTIDPGVVDQYVIFGALMGAIAWNLFTWYYAIPSSSSHALIGGLVGAAVAKSGTGALAGGGLLKTIEWIVLSPLLGFIF